MRYKKIVFITILSATLIYACSKTVLEKRPLGSLDEIEIANKDGVERFLIGAYSLLDGEGGNKSRRRKTGGVKIVCEKRV